MNAFLEVKHIDLPRLFKMIIQSDTNNFLSHGIFMADQFAIYTAIHPD